MFPHNTFFALKQPRARDAARTDAADDAARFIYDVYLR